ncbi:MAG: hypothetical protein R3B13_05105 [Polyangiaceae bacterium]
MATKSEPQRLSTNPTQRSLEATKPPDFQVIRKREEEPSEATPIIYREYAYAVAPETTSAAAELLIWVRFKEICAGITKRTERKFVQLAVFDHVFEKRPERAPIATLAWRDWRGDPVVVVHGVRVDSPGDAKTAEVAPSAATAPSAAAAPSTAVPSKQVESAPPRPENAPLRSESAPKDVAATVQPSAGPATATSAVASQPSAAPAAAAEPAGAVEPVAAASEATAPAAAEETRASEPPPSSRRIAPGKRRKSEDLIGELFETMHELHFLPDMVSGTEFVLSIVESMLPSEGAILHVFDINTRHFVVVRAYGQQSEGLLLHRTPDVDPFFNSAMRRTRAVAVSGGDEKYAGTRWKALGVTPSEALFGSVQLGGRYLGAVEIANPAEGGKYSESEANALEYICAQFAEFLAARPIVLDADVVLPKH